MTLSARITTLMDYVSQAASIGTPNGYFVGDTKARSRTERDSKTRRLNMRTAESRLRAARTALDAGDPDMALLLTDEAERLVIEAKRNGTKIFAATETRGRATSDRNAKFADAVDAGNISDRRAPHALQTAKLL